MTEIRIIKKYPNRRLYDCSDSRYITLEDLRRMAFDKVDFKVIERNSGREITNRILLQVIAAQEQGANGLLGKEFLLQLIRSHGNCVASQVRDFLQASLTHLLGGDAAPTVAARPASR